MTDFSSPPLTPARFYRHSGRAPANAILIGLVAAIIPSSVLGALWGFLELYLHLAPAKLMLAGMIFGLLGLGYALGYVPAFVLIRFKSRSSFITATFTILSVLIGLYTAWVVFVFEFLVYQHVDVSLFRIANPVHLSHIIPNLNATGIWSIFDQNTFPKGIVLSLFWLGEIFVLLTIALRTAMKQLNKQTFCETCGTWGTMRPIMEISDNNWPQFKQSVGANPIEALAAVTPRSYGSASWCSVAIEGCPTCDNMQTLTITRTVVTPAKKGKSAVKTKDIVRRLILTPEQTVQIAITAAGLKNPAPPASSAEA